MHVQKRKGSSEETSDKLQAHECPDIPARVKGSLTRFFRLSSALLGERPQREVNNDRASPKQPRVPTFSPEFIRNRS